MSSFEFLVSFFGISRSFDGHKEIVLVATPIEQGLALQLVHKQGKKVHYRPAPDRKDLTE